MVYCASDGTIPSLASQVTALEELEIFSDLQIRGIKNNREFYERTLNGTEATCEGLLQFVRYELDLLAVIREEEVQKKLIGKKTAAVCVSANLLNKLFAILTNRFPNELQLWCLYVKFCQGMRDTTTLLSVLESMLKAHGTQTIVFQLASRCSREDFNCLAKAREYLLRGIRVHAEACELYREAFALELAVCRQEFDASGQVSMELINHVYDAARVKIHSVDFFIDLVFTVRGISFANELENRILDDLRKRFPDDEIMWDTLATAKHDKLKVPENLANYRPIIEEIIEIYRTSVEHVDTPKMWGLYLDRMLDICNDPAIVLPKFKKNNLIFAFKTAHERRKLNDKYYLMWAELQKNEERKLELLTIATRVLPTSVPLWSKLILNRLSSYNERDMWKLFKEALSHFGSQSSLPLWKILLRYYQCSCPSKVEWFFEQGILAGSGVAGQMKAMYLEWAAVSLGIAAARELYYRIAPERPFSTALHDKMIELENYQVKLNIKSLRRCHSLATEQFGAHDISVWMRSIHFENEYGQSRKSILQIKDRALDLLQPALVDEFSSEMRMFEIGCLTALPQRQAAFKLNQSLCRRAGAKKLSCGRAKKLSH